LTKGNLLNDLAYDVIDMTLAIIIDPYLT